MRHPLLVKGRPNFARQSLASTLSAPRVAATSYCDPGRHANVITPCLLTPCLNVHNICLYITKSKAKTSKINLQISICNCFRADGAGWPCFGSGMFRIGHGEGVKSARGETAILGRGDHTRSMFGTSLHTTFCKQTSALETAEIVQ